MSEKAKSILVGFQELRKFCKELSVLLITADGMMREDGWTPIPRTSVTGNSSGKVDQPERWLPTEFSRFYQRLSRKRQFATVSCDNTMVPKTLVSRPVLVLSCG